MIKQLSVIMMKVQVPTQYLYHIRPYKSHELYNCKLTYGLYQIIYGLPVFRIASIFQEFHVLYCIQGINEYNKICIPIIES